VEVRFGENSTGVNKGGEKRKVAKEKRVANFRERGGGGHASVRETNGSTREGEKKKKHKMGKLTEDSLYSYIYGNQGQVF